MRVIHCISSLSGGGAERQLSYIAPLMAKKGIDVHVAFLTEGPRPPIRDINIIWHKISHKSNYDPMICWRFFSIFKRLSPDIVHTWIPQIDVMAGSAAILSGKHWVLREAITAEDHHGLKSRLRSTLAQKTSYVIANSIAGKEYWKKIAPSVPCKVIYNGIPHQLIIDKNNIQHRHKKSASTIVFAGRLVAQKNIFLLLKALVALSGEIEFKCLICGMGPLKKEMLQFINRNALSKRVHLLGHVSRQKLHELLKNSALLVVPSHYEGCPNIVLEAMATGCPLAVSMIPAHTDILDSNSAFFFHPENSSELKEIIKIALTNPEIAIEKALVARKAVEKFSLDKTVLAYIEIYREIIFAHGNTI